MPKKQSGDPIKKAMKVIDDEESLLSPEAGTALRECVSTALVLDTEAQRLKAAHAEKKEELETSLQALSRLLRRARKELDAKVKLEKAAIAAQKAAARTTAPKKPDAPKKKHDDSPKAEDPVLG